MSAPAPRGAALRRTLAAAGAFGAGAAIALYAWTAHALPAGVALRLQPALLFLLLHGALLAVLAPRQHGRLERAALLCWGLGTALFSGSLLLAAAFGTSTAPAPAGGLLLILGWVVQGVAALRRAA